MLAGRYVALSLVLSVAGCTDATTAVSQEGSGNPASGLTTTGTPQATTAMGATTGGSTAADTEENTSEPPPVPVGFDVGVIPDAPDFDLFGCAGIDFLFVIDNSGSMGSFQNTLLNSFDGFIEAIQLSLDNVSSYHVGVITSDAYSANAPGCNTLGDLVTQTQNGACGPFLGGNRFATDMNDLDTLFPCMANVGTFGSPIEQPASGTVAALSAAKLAPGGCNEGFIRDDAILVIVMVTDDPVFDFDVDDAHPTTDPNPWYPAVLAAKNNDPEAVVMIGFVPTADSLCTFGGASPNLVSYVEDFGLQGVLASVCEPDYGVIFAESIATIESTCDNYVPG